MALGVAVLGSIAAAANRVQAVPARQAFTYGLGTAAAVSVAVAIVLAMLAVVLLRHARSTPDPSH